jgi:hypothetical protein
MRTFIISALALGAILIPGQAAAADDATDRRAAIELCRAEITAQSGLDAQSIRFDQVRTRLSTVRVDFDVWRDNRLTNVRCDVARGAAELTIAAITPSLSTATASVR